MLGALALLCGCHLDTSGGATRATEKAPAEATAPEGGLATADLAPPIEVWVGSDLAAAREAVGWLEEVAEAPGCFELIGESYGARTWDELGGVERTVVVDVGECTAGYACSTWSAERRSAIVTMTERSSHKAWAVAHELLHLALDVREGGHVHRGPFVHHSNWDGEWWLPKPYRQAVRAFCADGGSR